MPRSLGHVFYDRLQGVLIDAGFDAFVEAACKPYYAAKMGADSCAPGISVLADLGCTGPRLIPHHLVVGEHLLHGRAGRQ